MNTKMGEVERVYWIGVKVPKEATSREIASLLYGPSYDVQSALFFFIADAKPYVQLGAVNDRKYVVRIELSPSHLTEMVAAVQKTSGYKILWVVDNVADLNFLGQHDLPSTLSFVTSYLE